MPKRDKHERPKDPNQLAHHLVEVSTSEDEGAIELPTKAQVSMWMSRIGRKGGKVGGKRRLETMTSKERSQVAKKAAEARWSKEAEE